MSKDRSGNGMEREMKTVLRIPYEVHVNSPAHRVLIIYGQLDASKNSVLNNILY